MPITAQQDVKSANFDQNELRDLFSQMLNLPQESKNNIIQALANTESVQAVSQTFPTTFNVVDVKARYMQQIHYLRLFPNVFVPLTQKTTFAAGWRAKLILKWARVPFTVDTKNFLHLKTVSFTKISLLLQMLIYLSENKIIEPSDLVHANHSSTATYLNEHLGVAYSQGQFIDFVDVLYDQYKHTKLSPYSFRHLFRCFGCHTPTIGNVAFDHYIQLRNTESAWQLAVVNFLQNNLSLPESVAQSVSKLLIQKQPF